MSGVLAALGVYTLLVVAFLYRLLPVWSTHIPGGLQDTRLFLWNAWWFHHSVSVLNVNPFQTTLMFWPFGVRLISHDFPLWMNLLTGFGQSAGLSMIAASNLWFSLSWVLMGFCTYGLVKEVTGKTSVSIVSGMYAMTHSYMLARAMQNWGQFNAYGIALFLWALMRARRIDLDHATSKARMGPWLLAGTALAWTAACHFYFLIYSLLIWMAVAMADLLPFKVEFSRRSSPVAVRRPLLGIASILGLVGLGIHVHPGIHTFAGVTLSMQNPANVLFLMWLLLMGWAATFVCVNGVPAAKTPHRVKHHLILVGTAALLLSPLFWETFRLLWEGGYPKQSILWKTHLPGANVLALLVPNPFHTIWGSDIVQWFTTRGMDAQEQASAIGWVCIAVVLGSGVWRESKRWALLAGAATLLAMGTHLHVLEHNLWLPMPFFATRLLPLLGNVRVPERWMAVGCIAWAVLLAMGLVHLSKTRAWSLRLVCAGVGALILFENWPGIPFVPTSSSSPVYETLRDLPAGGVLPLPLYIGDSSIGTGDSISTTRFTFPWHHLWAQTIHHQPMLGGYIGRIPRTIIDRYKTDPFIRRVLDLEEGKSHDATPEPGFGTYAYRSLQFQYVLVYPQATSPEALAYALNSLPLELITQDPDIQLYKIKG